MKTKVQLILITSAILLVCACSKKRYAEPLLADQPGYKVSDSVRSPQDPRRPVIIGDTVCPFLFPGYTEEKKG